MKKKPMVRLSFLLVSLMGNLFLLPFETIAQSAFLPVGENGMEISVGTAWTDELTGYGGSVGFSIKGRVDLRFAVTLFPGPKDGTAYSPTIEVLILKSSAISPIGVSSGLSAEMASFGPTGSVTSDALSVFATASYLFQMFPSIGIMPVYEIRGIFSLEQSWGSYRILPSTPFGNRIRSYFQRNDTQGATLMQALGAAVIFGSDGQTKVLLSPHLAITNNTVLLGIEAATVF